MIEVSNVRQLPDEPRRRWFSSADFDLFVQCADGPGFVGFQLYYDKALHERAIIYREATGFCHVAVDDGEQRPGKYKASPVLLADGAVDVERVYAAFSASCADLPEDVADYVRSVLLRHPEFPAEDDQDRS